MPAAAAWASEMSQSQFRIWLLERAVATGLRGEVRRRVLELGLDRGEDLLDLVRLAAVGGQEVRRVGQEAGRLELGVSSPPLLLDQPR